MRECFRITIHLRHGYSHLRRSHTSSINLENSTNVVTNRKRDSEIISPKSVRKPTNVIEKLHNVLKLLHILKLLHSTRAITCGVGGGGEGGGGWGGLSRRASPRGVPGRRVDEAVPTFHM